MDCRSRRRACRPSHNYKPNDTTTLFAARDVLNGQVIAQCQQRRRHTEWLQFLRQIDRETPKDAALHLVCDNHATHKHQRVQIHFTPPSASWLNMVQRFFRSISTVRLARGVFRSVPDLIRAIDEYITLHNRCPKPFVWTAKANDILQRSHSSQPQAWFEALRGTRPA